MQADRLRIHSAGFRPRTQLRLVSGAGAESREEVRLKVRKWRGRDLGYGGSLAGWTG